MLTFFSKRLQPGISLCCLCLFFLLRAGAQSDLKPVNLRVEYKANAFVDVPAPRLSWELQSAVNDQVQTARGREFVDASLESESNRLENDFRPALCRRTGSHPLFTVELLRHMQQSGDLVKDADGCWVAGPNLRWNSLPSRIEGIFEEGIGRLEQELRESLTVGSVEGEQFTAEVVARVKSIEVRNLVRQFSGELEKDMRLLESQGVERVGQQRLSHYRFTNKLMQAYLYDDLDEVELSYLHEDVGSALEEIYGSQAAEVAVQLARHFDLAGVTD